MAEQKEPNWSKPIFFSLITDNRFDKNIKAKINHMHRRVLAKLSNPNKFDVYHGEIYPIDFSDSEGNKQYRVHYRVRINKNNTKKKELYAKVNSVKAVYYGTRWGD